MKIMTHSLLASSLAAALWLNAGWAEAPDNSAAPVNSAAPAAPESAVPAAPEPATPVVPEPIAPAAPESTAPAASEPTAPAIQQESALADLPPPAGLEQADRQLSSAAAAAPFVPGQPVIAPAPAAALNQPISSTISVAQMGQQQGIILSGGQLQSGIVFTLPGDEVITNARLNLSLRVSQALAARNTSLQLMLNGQPLGTLPLGASDSDVSDYQLEIPAAMVVASNNLSFKINDADKLLCEKESAQNYQVTILPKTTLSLEGQQLNIGTRLRNFPRPFIDPLRMTPASVAMGFASNVAPDAISAAALVASWLGIQSDYRTIRFPVSRGELPEQNGILFGHPGDRIGALTLPQASGPQLTLVDNPNNPVYKLLLVTGEDDAQLRQAALRLTTQPLNTDASSLVVQPQPLASRSLSPAANPTTRRAGLTPAARCVSTSCWTRTRA